MPLLSLAIWLPIGAGVLLLAFGRDDRAEAVRWFAFLAALASFLVTIPLITEFNLATPALQFTEKHAWIARFNVWYTLGVDGLSVWFVLLTAFTTVIVVVSAWKVISERVNQYMGAFLILSGLLVGVFCAMDGLLFYVFFEATLIPMYLIIGVWGGPRRVYAAFKFFLYTLAGSLLMLVALIYLYYKSGGSFDILAWHRLPLSMPAQVLIFFAFFFAFAVKVPMWPVHTWLPDAHVEAPTAGSVILAGVLLKMGGYGFIRFSVTLMPEATQYFAPLIFGLSVVAVIYTSLVALVQEDMKKLIAYSSVAHMGFVTIGIYVMNMQGVQGGIFQMLSHGIVSAALFLCVGVVYDRMHTREISAYGGLVHRMPRYAFVFMFFTLASVGLPGLSGFVGEFLVLVGTFKANTWVAFLAATGLILGAAYALWLYRKIIFGELTKDTLKAILDMSPREVVVFLPLVLITIWMGIYPNSFLDPMAASVDKLIGDYNAALKLARTAALQ
jgi:NADH-quinone oxidoreductase subunit M